MNGGQIIVDYLIQENVSHAFGLCGHGNISFIDALYDRSAEITSYSVRHESISGFMADVYYRVAGRPAATFTSCGPGSANIPICLANAYFDSVPYLAITGNVPTSQFNRGAFQETYRHYQADFPLGREALLQARVPAHAGRASAALHPPGVENHGHRPPRTGRPRCAV